MKYELNDIERLIPVGRDISLPFYKLEGAQWSNRYYVVSSPGTCELMANPGVVGYKCLESMEPATIAALRYLNDQEAITCPHIFTILRGGLNFPLEQAMYMLGLTVRATDFVTCERVISDGEIQGLDIKYEKLIPEQPTTMLIGDIVASGQTLMECMPLVAQRYRELGGSIDRIIFFTIGGTKAIGLMESITEELRKVWPSFRGIDCVFYEGVFTVYEDKGVTGVNTPDIDFGMRGGAVAPEFRSYLMNNPLALYEKCIIYDGGARRYELANHVEEVNEYWHSLAAVAPGASMERFTAEKLGYTPGISYEQWLVATHLADMPQCHEAWQREAQAVARVMNEYSLAQVCENRHEAFNLQIKQIL